MENFLDEIKEFDNIREIINNAVKLHPNNNAFIIKNKKGKDVSYTNITFKHFQDDINCLGTALIKLGLKGKHIALIGKNGYEWPLSYYSVVNGTGVIVPLDKGLSEAEIENCIIQSKSEAIIFEDSYLEMIENIKARGKTSIKEFICMNEIQNEGYKNLKDLILLGKKEIKNKNKKFIDAYIDNEKMSIILFTSGTTSTAKAVMLSHKNIAKNVYALTVAEKVYSNDVNMAFLPFHHTFGSTGLLFFLSRGATTVFCDGLRYVGQNLKEYKVTSFFCVPLIIEAMHKKLMQEIEKKGMMKKLKQGLALSKALLAIGIDKRRKIFKSVIDGIDGSMRFLISGAAPINRQVSKFFNDIGILTVQGYGLTETSPVLCAEALGEINYGSVGLPLCNVDVKIDNPDEKGIGEIIARGPNIMLGYYENKEATDAVFTNEWFHTGDLGYKDKKGYIFICGRKKNVIILKNGKNVYPEEIEVLIDDLPYVVENIVIGIPEDDDYSLAAKIVYNKEYIDNHFPGLTKEQLEEKVWQDIKKINQGLRNYKHIKQIILTEEEMKKTTTNKIKRYEEVAKVEK